MLLHGRWLAHRLGGDDALIVGSGAEAGIEKDGGIVSVVDLAGEAGRGDVDGDRVEQVGGVTEFADNGFGLRHRIEAFAVVGGELEAEEESVGPLGVNEVAGEGVDDLRESKLDGELVFQRRESDDVTTLRQALGADHSVAIDAVAFVELAMKVAEMVVGESDAVALQTVAFDVATEIDLHGSSSWNSLATPGGGGGWWLKVEWMQRFSKNGAC